MQRYMEDIGIGMLAHVPFGLGQGLESSEILTHLVPIGIDAECLDCVVTIHGSPSN